MKMFCNLGAWFSSHMAQPLLSLKPKLFCRKVEEKKPRWQPPRAEKENELTQKTVNDAKDRHVSSPRKEYESYQGPVRSPGPKNNTGADLPHSPKTKAAPAPPHLTGLYGPAKPPRAISPVRCPSPKRSPAPSAPGGSRSPVKVSTYTVDLQKPERPQSPKFQHQVHTNLILALNAPISTKVICFSRLLPCLRSLYGK